jgi:hypothetical protein
MTAADRFTAGDIHKALWWHFSDRWALLTEVTARAVYQPPDDPAQAVPAELVPRWTKVSKDRRIDVLLLRGGGPQRDGGIERIAVEIKVTRGDFLADVRNPDKQAPWRGIAHRHAYAVPEGLVAENEVPAGSGLLVVRRVDWGGGFAVRWGRNAKKPPGHAPGPLPLAIQMDAFYRAGRDAAKLKGHDTSARATVDNPDEMRAENLRLRHEVGLLHNRIDREVDTRKRWQAAYAALGQPACGTCGQPLHVARKQIRATVTWEHRVPADRDACELLRRAEAIRKNNERAEDLSATRSLLRMDEQFLYVPDPEPAELTPASAP